MTNQPTNETRLIAIEPFRAGFGYVVFEGPQFLVDWGIREVRKPKNIHCLKAAARLIALYRPHALILENSIARGSRRNERVRCLIDQLSGLAQQDRMGVHRISHLEVRKTFEELGASNKHQGAQLLAARFPELASRLPPDRRPWMSEDKRMAIFDAAALGITCYLSKASPKDGAVREFLVSDTRLPPPSIRTLSA